MPFPVLAAIIVLGFLAVIHSVVLIGLVRITSEIYRVLPQENARASGETVRPAPTFAVESMGGSLISNETLLGRAAALIFVLPSCSSCMTTLDELEAVRVKAADAIVIVCGGAQDECAELVTRFRPIDIVHDPEQRLKRLFDVREVPGAVLIAPDGQIGSYGQLRRKGVEGVIDQAMATSRFEADERPLVGAEA